MKRMLSPRSTGPARIADAAGLCPWSSLPDGNECPSIIGADPLVEWMRSTGGTPWLDSYFVLKYKASDPDDVFFKNRAIGLDQGGGIRPERSLYYGTARAGCCPVQERSVFGHARKQGNDSEGAQGRQAVFFTAAGSRIWKPPTIGNR